MYPYEVEQNPFSFSIDQGQEYKIPYVRVSGLQDAELQWKINHTLWENACWIFDCAELTTQTIMEQYGGIRKINKDTNVIILTRVGKTDRVLSILRNVFNWWIKPEYFEYSTDIFRKWYKREEGV